MKKLLLLILITMVAICLSVTALAEEAIPENYVQGEATYTVYTDAQYQEVLTGIKDGTLENKTVMLGSDIQTKFDFVMDTELDITIDLNNFSLDNTYVSNKSGDFDLQNENAILRIKNGKMSSTFCMFIFRTHGQVYGENLEIVSKEECFYQYGGFYGVISLKNCSIDITDGYSAVSVGGSCGEKGGMLYQLEDCTLDGLNLFCSRPGSYVKNCTVYDRDLKIDSWHAHGENNTDVTIELANVKVTDGVVHLNDKRIDPILYDCEYQGIDMTGGEQIIVVYTSASCQKAATKTTYTSTEDNVTVDEQYSIDNPAKGHMLAENAQVVDIGYPNGFATGGYCDYICEACKTQFTEDTPSASAIFVPMGYTSNSDSTGFGTGFQINKDALLAYESINGTKITFGIVVFNPQYLNGETFVDGKINTTRGSVQSDMDTSYASCKLLVEGFTQSHASLELVFVGYAYEGENTSEIQLMQKEYVSTEENPIASPMCSQINGLYTVKLATITAPSAVGNKESLDEFVKKTA